MNKAREWSFYFPEDGETASDAVPIIGRVFDAEDDALKDFVPANPQGRVRFSIYDLTRAFRAGISMAREDIAALVSGSREDGADAP